MWRRGVALARINYNRWDFLPLQMTICLTVAILAAFALSDCECGRSFWLPAFGHVAPDSVAELAWF
jgi:hypothetical protein